MKLLITHINPHLDDIAAIWLFRKFNPDFNQSKVHFIPAAKDAVTWEGKPVDSDPDVIHFGIGRGKFDEHKGDINECATSLVWNDIVLSNKAPQIDIQKKAYERLVEWVRLEDTGRLPLGEYVEFTVPAFIRSKESNEYSSQKSLDLGIEILDRILKVLTRKEQAIKDWEERVEFSSRFGKSYAVRSDAVDRVFSKEKGGDLFIMYSPSTGFVQFFTPSHEIDLEPIYKKVVELDPDADWFLHHSHHMVICGSGAAPEPKKTKLSFEQLLDAAKNV